jgi:hypothetical protein
MENMISKRYSKEINIKYAIIGSFIPIWNFFIAIRLGRKYGPLWLLTDFVIISGLSISMVFIVTENANIGFIMMISLFPIHGIITYLFIKKYNQRVLNG